MSTRKLTTTLLVFLIGFPQFAAGIFSPALPDLSESLNVTPNLAQLTLSIYFYGFALGVFYWGVLADKIGRRKAIMTGISVFIVATIGCAVSDDIYWLTAFRFFNGLGAAAGSISSTLVRDRFTSNETRSRMMATLAIFLAFCPAIGSWVGGYVVEYGGWEACFNTLTVVGAFVLVYAYFKLPETVSIAKLKETKVNIKKVAKKALTDSRVMCCAVLIAGFNAALFGSQSELSFYTQEHLGLTASEFGYFGVFCSFASAFGATLSRKLTTDAEESSYRIIQYGVGLFTLASLIFLFISYTNEIFGFSSLYLIVVILLLYFMILLSFGLVVPMSLSSALVDYGKVQGTAGAVFGLVYYIMISSMLELVRYLHDGKLYALPQFLCIITFFMLIAVVRLKKDMVRAAN